MLYEQSSRIKLSSFLLPLGRLDTIFFREVVERPPIILISGKDKLN